MMLVYCSVRKTELRSRRYRFPEQERIEASGDLEFASSLSLPSSSSRRLSMVEELPMTHRMSYQSIGYMVAFIGCYIFPTTSRIMLTASKVPPYAVRLLAVSTVTSQGFWNWAVYFLLSRWYHLRFGNRHSTRQHSRTSASIPRNQRSSDRGSEPLDCVPESKSSCSTNKIREEPRLPNMHEQHTPAQRVSFSAEDTTIITHEDS